MTVMKSTALSNLETFGAEDLQRMYHTRFDGRQEYRNKVWRVLIREFFQQFVRRDDTVLDLGAGYGEFINHIHCYKKYAIDINPETRERVNEDVEIFLQDCSESWPLPDNSLDVVFTSNFFEHLPDTQTLVRVVDEIVRCLKPGGRVIAMGPNIKYVLGAYWDFIDHHLPLTELSLSEVFIQQGLEIEKCVARLLPYTMATGPQYPVIFLAFYLRLPFAWRIFGKQFLVVAKKSTD